MVTLTGAVRAPISTDHCVLQAGVLVVLATLGSAGAGGGCSRMQAPQGTPQRDPQPWYGWILPWHWLCQQRWGPFLGVLMVTDMYLMTRGNKSINQGGVRGRGQREGH